MKLFIDTSSNQKIVIGLDEKRFEADAKEEKSQKLLPFLLEVLKNEGKDLKDVTEIEVNTGPGSFTGLRVGVAVANTLSWALKVPVNGKDISKGESVDIEYQ